MQEIKETVDIVTQLSSAISEYGLPVVVMAVFFMIFLSIQYLMYKQVENHNKISNDIIKENIERNHKLMDMIINKSIENANNNNNNIISDDYVKREQALIEVCIKVNRRLKNECKRIASIISADRVAIYVFHNGAFSISGSPFFKFSCICEYIALGSGIRSQYISHTNLPINLLEDAIDTLWKDGNITYFAKDQDTSVLGKILFDDDKKQVSLLYTIYNSEERPLGFITVEYAKPDITLDYIHDKKDILKDFSDRISPILELSAYRKENLKEAKI